MYDAFIDIGEVIPLSFPMYEVIVPDDKVHSLQHVLAMAELFHILLGRAILVKPDKPVHRYCLPTVSLC